MALKPQTVDYRALIKNTSFAERAELVRTSAGQQLLASLKPSEVASLFPEYYQRANPAVANYITSRTQQSSAAPTSTGTTPPPSGRTSYGTSGATGTSGVPSTPNPNPNYKPSVIQRLEKLGVIVPPDQETGANGKYRPKYEGIEKDLQDPNFIDIVGNEARKTNESIDAVIHNMMNRLGSPSYGSPTSLSQVAKQEKQYAAWEELQIGKKRPIASEQHRDMIRERARLIASGALPDITGGANEFRGSFYVYGAGVGKPFAREAAQSGIELGGNIYLKRGNFKPGPYAAFSEPRPESSSQQPPPSQPQTLREGIPQELSDYISKLPEYKRNRFIESLNKTIDDKYGGDVQRFSTSFAQSAPAATAGQNAQGGPTADDILQQQISRTMRMGASVSTANRQGGIDVAMSRMHPEFAVRAQRAIQKLEEAGITGVHMTSTFRPYEYGTNRQAGWDPKDSIHGFGLGSDFGGLPAYGTAKHREAVKIMESEGLHWPWKSAAEYNHFQITPNKTLTGDKELYAAREAWAKSGYKDPELARKVYELSNKYISGELSPQAQAKLSGQSIVPEGPTAQTAARGSASSHILMTGITTNYSEQTQLNTFQAGVGSGAKVLQFGHGSVKEIKDAILANPNAPITLFSQGAANAAEIARFMKKENIPLDRLRIVQHHYSADARVRDAIAMGVPASNVVIGNTPEVGSNLSDVTDITKTGLRHIDSLQQSDSLISQRRQAAAQQQTGDETTATAQPTQNGRVYIGGDSIGHGVATAGGLKNAVNLANPGKFFTKNSSRSRDYMMEQLMQVPPGRTIHMFAGTNNSGSNVTDPKLFDSQIARMAEYAQKNNITLKLYGPHKSEPLKDRTGRWKEDWDAKNGDVVDQNMADAAAKYGISYTSTRDVTATAGGDGIHFDAKGYRTLARKIDQAQPASAPAQQQGPPLPTQEQLAAGLKQQQDAQQSTETQHAAGGSIGGIDDPNDVTAVPLRGKTSLGDDTALYNNGQFAGTVMSGEGLSYDRTSKEIDVQPREKVRAEDLREEKLRADNLLREQNSNPEQRGREALVQQQAQPVAQSKNAEYTQIINPTSYIFNDNPATRYINRLNFHKDGTHIGDIGASNYS